MQIRTFSFVFLLLLGASILLPHQIVMNEEAHSQNCHGTMCTNHTVSIKEQVVDIHSGSNNCDPDNDCDNKMTSDCLTLCASSILNSINLKPISISITSNYLPNYRSSITKNDYVTRMFKPPKALS